MAPGQTLLDGALNGKVETEDCTWCLVNGGTELNVMLTKQNAAGPWSYVELWSGDISVTADETIHESMDIELCCYKYVRSVRHLSSLSGSCNTKLDVRSSTMSRCARLVLTQESDKWTALLK